MKAHYLLKQNIDTLLKARGQKRKELAAWCRRTESWLSQIFTNDERNVPLKYLDRIASFFGLATYQLFQPGISPLTERRQGQDRRKVKDRRISRAVMSEQPGDVDLIHLVRALTTKGRQRAIGYLVDLVNDELRGPHTITPDADVPASTAETLRVKRARRKQG